MKKIPDEIEEIMSYLSHVFSKSMKHPVYSKEDLYNELVVLYLTHLKSGTIADTGNKNQWYVFFKSRLINQYRRLLNEKKLLSDLTVLPQED